MWPHTPVVRQVDRRQDADDRRHDWVDVRAARAPEGEDGFGRVEEGGGAEAQRVGGAVEGQGSAIGGEDAGVCILGFVGGRCFIG